MRKQTLLVAVLALILCSVLAVTNYSDADADQGQTLAASYSGGVLSVEGKAPSGYSGGQVTFEIFGSDGSKVSDSYASVLEDLHFECSISLPNLASGGYWINVSYSAIGLETISNKAVFTVGNSEYQVNTSYSNGILTISGKSPVDYYGGIYTCSVFLNDAVLSDAYGCINTDGSFSIAISIGDLDSGDYLIQSKFDHVGSTSYFGYSIFSTESIDSEFGDYSLEVVSVDTQCAEFKSYQVSDGSLQGTYVLEYEISEESLTITGFRSNDNSIILLIPASVMINGKEYEVSDISELTFNGDLHIAGVVFSDKFKSSVPNNAFSNCTNLTFVEFSPFIQYIGSNAFFNTSLDSVSLPRDLETIEFQAFYQCKNLKTVTAQDGASGLRIISIDAFASDDSLIFIKIPMKDLEEFNLTSGGLGGKSFVTLESTNGYGKYVLQEGYKNWIFATNSEGIVDTLVFIPEGTTGDIIIPEGIKVVKAVFTRCAGEFTVTFPASLEKYDSDLGMFNSGVTKVTFREGCKIQELGRMFYRCNSLESVTIPSSVTILKNTFQQCSHLKDVYISSKEIDIQGAFSNCKSMTASSLHISEGSKVSLQSDAFGNCNFESFDLPNGIVKIDEYAFSNCKNLTSVKISHSVEEISLKAFSGCSSLKVFNTDESDRFIFTGGVLLNNGELVFVPQKAVSVTIPGTVSTVLTDHFKGLSNLTDVSFEEGNNDLIIPDNCFEYCFELRQVQLSPNIISIGKQAFNGCSKLSEVSVPENSSLSSIGAEAFMGTGLLEFYLPSSVKTIGDSAFENCNVLAMVEVPVNSSLQTIGNRAFASTVIRSFMVASGVESIGMSCFEGCALLSAVSVQDGNVSFSMKNGALCKGSVLIFVPAGLTELTIASDITGYELSQSSSAFSSAGSLRSITVADSNTTYSSENGILLKNTDSGIVIDYVPAAIGCVEISSVIKSIECNNTYYAAFRDVDSLEKFVWKTDTATLVGGSLQAVNSIGTFVVEAGTINIESAAFYECEIDTVILKSSGTVTLGSRAFYCTNIGSLLVEAESANFAGVFKNSSISAICTDNISFPFEKIIPDTDTSVYTKEPTVLELPYGTIAGTYIVDVNTWSIDLSVGTVDDKPVFIDNTLDGIDAAIDTEASVDGRIVLKLTNNGFTKTFWDIDVTVNGVSADNGGTGVFSAAILSSAERIDVEICAHAAASSAKVIFSTDGGTEISVQFVPLGGTLYGAMPSDPIRNGYTFKGWYSDSAYTTVFDPTGRIVGDTTVYAKWESNGDNARVTFDSDHGTVKAKVSGKEISSGDLVPKGSTVELEYVSSNGWEFIYWIINGTPLKGDANSITVDADTVISPALRYTSQSNSLTNLIDVKTPKYGEDVTLQWSHHYAIDTGMSVWSGFPSVPAVMDDAVYIRASDTLYKYDSKTGEELCRVVSKTLVAYYLYLGVGGGVIVDYATDKVFDADLNYLYTTEKHFGAVFYNQYDGYFYGLSAGKVYKFEPSSGKMVTTGSWSDGVEVTWFGLYGTTSAPVFTDDHMYIVSATASSDYRGLTAIDLKGGSTSVIELKGESGRLLDDGWLTTYSLDGKRYLFLTTYSQGLFDTGSNYRTASIIGVETNSNGTLSQDCKTIRVDTERGALSAFVVYNGRGYASGLVMDANKICRAISSGTTQISWAQCQSEKYLIYEEKAVNSHGSIVVSTAYATPENDYTVYIYMLAYDPSQQAIYIFEDSQSKTEAGTYYRTSKAGDAYGSQAVRATADGNFVWYTDAGTVYCYGTPSNNPYVFEITYSGETKTVTGVGKTVLEALKSGMDAEGIQYDITNSGIVVSINGQSGDWAVQYYNEGKWFDAGLLTVDTLNVYHKFSVKLVSSGQDDSPDVDVVIKQTTANLYSNGETNRTVTLTSSIECDGDVEIIWSSDHPDVARISGSATGSSVVIEGLSDGTATISVTVRSGNKVTEAACVVTVTTAPLEDKLYVFEIRMDIDADKVVSETYTESMLESGITIRAYAKNAADALQIACDEGSIPLELYSNETLKGWIDSMFGLGDVNLGNGAWKYWIQYYEGSYNNYTLGYYTDGGTFQLVYGITKDMQDGVYSEKPNADGSKEYSKTTQYTDGDGNKIVEVIGATENSDGTKIGSFESNTFTSADGSVSSTTKVSFGGDGSVISAETVTAVSVSGGELNADIIQNALVQSQASIDKLSVEVGNIEKVLKIENSDGVRIHMSSEALGKITEYGAILKAEGSLGSSSGSLTVDTNICSKLSGGSLDLKLEEGKSSLLTDTQNDAVGDRYFIILTATVDGKTVHQLGGVATVEFGYALRSGENASDLCIYYVDESGNISRMADSVYNTETGMFTLHTDHFSVFMVGTVQDGVYSEKNNADGYLGLLVILAAAVILAMIVFGSAYYCEVVRLKKA